MKKLFLLLLLSFSFTSIYSQVCDPCCLQLNNISGVDFQADWDSVESESEKLIGSLDPIFHNNFRVYDFSFFAYKDDYIKNVKADWGKYKSQAENASDYYLLMGRQPKSGNVNVDIWVDVKFPEGLGFSCLTENIKQFYLDKLTRFAKTSLSSHGPRKFDLVEIEIIQELGKILNSIHACCDINSNKDICFTCPTVENLESFFADVNSNTIKLDEISLGSNIPETDTSKNIVNLSTIKEFTYYDLEFEPNINNEILKKFEELQSREKTSKAFIVSWENCESYNLLEIMDQLKKRDVGILILFTKTEDSSSIKKEGDDRNSVVEEYYMTLVYFDKLEKPNDSLTSSSGNLSFLSGSLSIEGENDSQLIHPLSIPVQLEFNVEEDLGFNLDIDLNSETNGVLVMSGYGYTRAANITFAPTVGMGASAGESWIYFTSGEYDYYPYHYVFGEATHNVGWDISVDLTFEGVLATGVGSKKDPESLEGLYDVNNTLSLTAASPIPFVNGGFSNQLNIPSIGSNPNQGGYWTIFSAGVSIGLGIDMFTVANMSVGTSTLSDKLYGETIMLTPQKKSENRSWFDKGYQWLQFFGPLGGPAANGVSNIFEFIESL